MGKKNQFLLLMIIVFCSTLLKAQDTRIDSLKQELSKAGSNLQKAEVYLELASEYLYIDPKLSFEFAQLTDTLIANKESRLFAKALLAKGISSLMLGNYDMAREKYLINCIELSRRINEELIQAKALNTLAGSYLYIGEYDKAIDFFNQAIVIFEKNNDRISASKSRSNLAAIYNQQGNYEKALENYMETLAIFKEENQTEDIPKMYLNIANVYAIWKDYDKAMKYFKEVDEMIGNAVRVESGIANFSMGGIFMDQEQYDSAEIYLNHALEIFDVVHEAYYKGAALQTMAQLNIRKENFNEALEYNNKAMSVFSEKGIKEGIARCYTSFGQIYRLTGDINQSIRNLKLAEDYSINHGSKDGLTNVYKEFAKSYKVLGDMNKAFLYCENYAELKDSIFSKEKAKFISEMQTKYETERKEQKILKQNITIERNKVEMQKQDFRQKTLIGILIAICIVIALALFSNYKIRKANNQIKTQNDEIKETNAVLEEHKAEIMAQNQMLLQQKEEMQVQADRLRSAFIEITEKKDLIEDKNREITDSIKYARKIQNALVTERKVVKEIIPESFILWKPLNIVSGDFYMVKKIQKYIIIILADCTGHGVPGAFMSMLGIAFINEIYQKRHVHHPYQALEELRNYVKSTLKQTGKEKEQKEGMDIAICAIDTTNLEMEYAGAYQPLYLIRNEELIEYKPTRCPIGIHHEELPFENNVIQLQEDDVFYLFTDGYVDQFGGEKTRKFKDENFRKLLMEIHKEPMYTQQFLLQKNLYEWIGDNNNQVDDVLVMGVKVQGLAKS